MFIVAEGGLILNVLNSRRLSLTKYPLSLNCCITFKGYNSWKDKNVLICFYIAVYYSIITVTTLLSLISYDIDSIYVFRTSLTAVC